MRMISVFSIALFLIALNSCRQEQNQNFQADSTYFSNSRTEIAVMLDSFNIAASEANYQKYFSYFTDDATYLGTDATEHWNKDSFMLWAKPFFDRGKAWHFVTIDRHIFFGGDTGIAWFDELLDTQMKICRGSGIVINVNGKWKIAQYVLSMTVPNSKTDSVVDLKSSEEDILIKKIRNSSFNK